MWLPIKLAADGVIKNITSSAIKRISIISLLLMVISCQPLLRSVVGINRIAYVSHNLLLSYAVKYNIDTSEMYIINSVDYLKFIKNLDTSLYYNKYIQHDMLQPLQIFSFKSNGKINLHLINCDVGGFPNLKWNRYGFFNDSLLDMPVTFLPDSTLTFEIIPQYFYPFTKSAALNNYCGKENTDNLVIYWNNFMGRQTKVMLDVISDYLNKYKSSYNVYYVNTDSLIEFKAADHNKVSVGIAP